MLEPPEEKSPRSYAEQMRWHLSQFWRHLFRFQFRQARLSWREYRGFKVMKSAMDQDVPKR